MATVSSPLRVQVQDASSYGKKESKMLISVEEVKEAGTLLCEEHPWFESDSVAQINATTDDLFNYRYVWDITQRILDKAYRQEKEDVKEDKVKQVFAMGFAQGLADHQVWEPADDGVLQRLSISYEIPTGQVKRLYDIVATNNLVTTTTLSPTVFQGKRVMIERPNHWGLFKLLSRVNHSCDPNCQLIVPPTRGVPLQLKNLRPLKAGEECTISYVASNSFQEIKSTKENAAAITKMLWVNFGIMCRCTLCTSRCQGCFESSNKRRLKCSKCHVATYCSKECQRTHWKLIHKQQCFK